MAEIGCSAIRVSTSREKCLGIVAIQLLLGASPVGRKVATVRAALRFWCLSYQNSWNLSGLDRIAIQ